MSSISVLQAPGPGQVTSVKPSNDASSPAPSTTTAGTAAVGGNAVPPYPTPRLEIDPQTEQAVLLYRDSLDGAPQYQVPSRAQLLLYQGTQAQASAEVTPSVTGTKTA